MNENENEILKYELEKLRTDFNALKIEHEHNSFILNALLAHIKNPYDMYTDIMSY